MAGYPTGEGACLQNKYGGIVTHTGLQFKTLQSMIKLNGLLQDVKLYEGLIHSVSIDTAIHHLKRWSTSNNKFTTKKTSLNTIHLNFGKQPTEKEIDNLLKWVNNLGWFVADYIVNEIPPTKKKFIGANDLKQSIKNNSLLNISLEAKYDLELSGHELDDLYHISPTKYINKISKIGLVPRTLSKISYHPERIYLTNNIKDAEALADIFTEDNIEEFTIYKIDVNMLLKSNNGIRFFRDPNLRSGIYTLSNIPPKFLKRIKQI